MEKIDFAVSWVNTVLMFSRNQFRRTLLMYFRFLLYFPLFHLKNHVKRLAIKQRNTYLFTNDFLMSCFYLVLQSIRVLVVEVEVSIASLKKSCVFNITHTFQLWAWRLNLSLPIFFVLCTSHAFWLWMQRIPLDLFLCFMFSRPSS